VHFVQNCYKAYSVNLQLFCSVWATVDPRSLSTLMLNSAIIRRQQ